MLKSVRIENFRSIESAEVPLGRMTVLFGPTAAGKSSLFYALLALRNFTLPETIFSVRASAERVPLTDDIPGEEGY